MSIIDRIEHALYAESLKSNTPASLKVWLGQNEYRELAALMQERGLQQQGRTSFFFCGCQVVEIDRQSHFEVK